MESLPVTLLQVLSQTLQIYSLVLIVRVCLLYTSPSPRDFG